MKRALSGVVLILVVFCAGVGYGLYSYEFETFPFWEARSIHIFLTKPKLPGPAGRWHVLDGGRAQSHETPQLIEELEAIGYVTGSRPAKDHTGVTILNQQSAFPGFNLYCSGHAAEAFLTRLDGEILHSWRFDFSRVWPQREVSDKATGTDYWRRIYLYENGDLLAIFEGFGLIKIDKDSNLLWALEGGYHHDLGVSESGEIWVLDREAHVVPRINARKPILEDFIAVVSPRGEVVRRFSILEAFERSSYESLLEKMTNIGDIMHTNALEILENSVVGISPSFRDGNLLISIRRLSTIAIIDVDTERVVWALTGQWRRQHDPTVLSEGSILLFNNEASESASRAMEFDPFSQEVLWSYEGEPNNPFFSDSCGTCQRLPNGNTLITESDAGRAFEVTSNNEIVWDFISPQRAGENKEFIALLPELVRLPTAHPMDWLD